MIYELTSSGQTLKNLFDEEMTRCTKNETAVIFNFYNSILNEPIEFHTSYPRKNTTF